MVRLLLTNYVDIFGKVRKPESKIIGRVYKIISDNTKYVYIGSTINTLHQRLKQHILDSKTNKTKPASQEPASTKNASQGLTNKPAKKKP